MTQGSLFDGDVTRSHHHGNTESEDAFADKIEPHQGALQARVLAQFHKSGEATVKEITELTGLERLTVGARLTELKAAGMIEKTGERREGCAVLRLTALGRLFAR